MRFVPLAAALTLALASGPAFADIARDPPSKSSRVKKPKATPTPAPAPAEVDEETAARRDEILAKAKHQSDMAEFLDARKLYREAIALDKTSEDAKKGLAAVELECLRNATRQISEAKAYQAANNDSEAVKSLELALKYADLETYKEHEQAMGMLKALKRNSER